ncbi:MAG: LPS assembly lipoprotein LptE [Prevotellaceae bacterium]|jgi:hypothetical protein|nr:LPS assembly lipoprotein LptE [Prevotellaceae bacterium]
MKKIIYILFLSSLLGLSSCLVSYKFNGSTIDYTKIKTITVIDFPNHAALVYPPLATNFSEALKDQFSQKTRLVFVPRNGDLQIEGEIVGYDLAQMAVSAAGESMETRLQITVNVRFTNAVNPSENFEERFTAFQTFSNTQTINQVQDELNEIIVDELISMIFNRSVANW